MREGAGNSTIYPLLEVNLTIKNLSQSFFPGKRLQGEGEVG